MLITTEKHEEFEAILLERGFMKGRSIYVGVIRLYTTDSKTTITYTSSRSLNNYVYVSNKEQEKTQTDEAENVNSCKIKLTKQILDQLLKESYTPKEYNIKETVLFNSEIELKIINIESRDIKILSVLDGLDHAIEIFEAIPVEIRTAPGEPLEETLCVCFMQKLLL